MDNEELALDSIQDQDIVDENAKYYKAIPKAYQKKNKNTFYEKECKVLKYNNSTKTLDVLFEKYGIRIKDVDGINGETVIVRYSGEIGKPNFVVINVYV